MGTFSQGSAVVSVQEDLVFGIPWGVQLTAVNAPLAVVTFAASISVDGFQANVYQPHTEPWNYLFHGSLPNPFQAFGNIYVIMEFGDPVSFFWSWTSVIDPANRGYAFLNCSFMPPQPLPCGCEDSIGPNEAIAPSTACQGCHGCNCTPLILDIDGDGFNLTTPEMGVEFDVPAEGVRALVSWTAPESDDAWLVLDRNGNGRIDDGSELFGNHTEQPPSNQPNGFLALAVFDEPDRGGNGDGIIDAHDAVYSKLQLWQDVNHNGVSEEGELHSLAALGVKAIDLDFHKSRRVDDHGNIFRYRAKVLRMNEAHDGRWVYDVIVHSP